MELGFQTQRPDSHLVREHRRYKLLGTPPAFYLWTESLLAKGSPLRKLKGLVKKQNTQNLGDWHTEMVNGNSKWLWTEHQE